MRRYAAAFLLASAVACSDGPSGLAEQAVANEERFAGGWDGRSGEGESSVLLLRSSLTGTLRATLGTYEVLFAAQGEVSEDGELLELELVCDEISETAATCTGWELSLACSLAGDCESGCNMVCDATDFGDAFATAGLSLEQVEQQLDYWERV